MTTVIIGGGIAGLYAAWRLCDNNNKNHHYHQEQRILVLEKNDVLGGRARTQSFVGTTIQTGAGVGRKDKDKRLTALLRALDVPFHTFEARQQYSPALSKAGTSDSRIAAFVKRCFVELRRAFAEISSTKIHPTFREFATVILGPQVYHQFVTASGYSDYENADTEDVLYRYGFDDNFTAWTAMGISWKDLVHTLAQKLRDTGRVHILRSTTVTKIHRRHDDHGPIVVFSNRDPIICKRLILATTVDTVQHLLPEMHHLYQHIHGQPFLRIYGQFAPNCRNLIRENVARTTIVPGPLHKLIPINVQKGVYMIAYTDNDDALHVERTLSSNPGKETSILCRMLERALDFPPESLKLDKITLIPWVIGTHFYDKLSNDHFASRRAFVHAAQRPYHNVDVVGEMVSLNHQGWVEGCLESVDRVIK